MKKILITLLAGVLLFSCKKNEQQPSENSASTSISQPTPPKFDGTRRILFVGNSHTEYFVSLPAMFDELCKTNNQNIEAQSLLEMGVSIDEILQAHQEDATTLFAQTDKDGNYFDYIVLQEKTPVAIDDLENYKANCKKIADLLKKNSPNAAIYIYELMSPFPNDDQAGFEEGRKVSSENAITVAKSLPNAGVLFIGDKISEAYSGKFGYQYKVNGKDNLRFGENTLHMLNDAGFLSSIYIYKTILKSQPKLPTQLLLSTGTADTDELKEQPIEKAISNPSALEKIALE